MVANYMNASGGPPPWGMPSPPQSGGAGGFDFRTNPMITSLASSLLANRGAFGPAMASFGQMAPQAMALHQQTQAKARQREAINAALKMISAGQKVTPEVLADLPEEWAMKLGMPPEAKAPIAVGKDTRLYDPNTKTYLDPPTGAGGTQPPYEGTSMDAQNWNIVLKGGHDTPEYAAAYNQLFLTPKMVQGQNEDGQLIVTPMMPTVPPGVKPPGVGTPSAVAPVTGGAPLPSSVGGPAPVADASGSVSVGKPIVIGQKRPTESEVKGRTLLRNVEGDYQKVTKTFDVLDDTVGQISQEFGPVGRLFQGGEYQATSDGVRNIIQSYIYAVSGAQAPEAEVERNMQLVMPRLLDKAEARKQKRQRLEGMMSAIRARASEPGAVVDDTGGGPVRIQGDADYDALPSGTEFVGPDGIPRRKP